MGLGSRLQTLQQSLPCSPTTQYRTAIIDRLSNISYAFRLIWPSARRAMATSNLCAHSAPVIRSRVRLPRIWRPCTDTRKLHVTASREARQINLRLIAGLDSRPSQLWNPCSRSMVAGMTTHASGSNGELRSGLSIAVQKHLQASKWSEPRAQASLTVVFWFLGSSTASNGDRPAEGYLAPPQPILDIIDRPPQPGLSFSPDRKKVDSPSTVIESLLSSNGL